MEFRETTRPIFTPPGPVVPHSVVLGIFAQDQVSHQPPKEGRRQWVLMAEVQVLRNSREEAISISWDHLQERGAWPGFELHGSPELFEGSLRWVSTIPWKADCFSSGVDPHCSRAGSGSSGWALCSASAPRPKASSSWLMFSMVIWSGPVGVLSSTTPQPASVTRLLVHRAVGA
jgi:hypothetical protein